MWNDEDDDADCTWAVEDDVVYAVTGAHFFPAAVEESESEEEEDETNQVFSKCSGSSWISKFI